MGTYIFDQFSLLHFSSGVIAYFFGVPISLWVLIHSLFEFSENTELGVHTINTYLKFWPGGKPTSDSIENIIGDTISALVGWIIAYQLDIYGTKKKWYNLETRR